MGDHSEGCSIMAVCQVDDIRDGWEHSSLATGTNGSVFLTHGQKKLEDLWTKIKN